MYIQKTGYTLNVYIRYSGTERKNKRIGTESVSFPKFKTTWNRKKLYLIQKPQDRIFRSEMDFSVNIRGYKKDFKILQYKFSIQIMVKLKNIFKTPKF